MKLRQIIGMCLRWMFTLLIAFVIFLSICLVGFRFSLSYILKQDNFKYLATHLMHVPVEVQHVQVQWYGFEPRVNLKNLMVLDQVHHRPIFQFKKIMVQIDLLESLLHRDLIPSRLIIQQAKLRLYARRSRQGQLSLGGANVHGDASATITRIAQWLTLQRYVEVNDAQLQGLGKLSMRHIHFLFDNRKQHVLLIQGRMNGSQWVVHAAFAGGLEDLKQPIQIHAQLNRLSSAVYTQWQSLLGAYGLHLPAQLSGSTQWWLKIRNLQQISMVMRYRDVSLMQGLVQLKHRAGRLTGVVDLTHERGDLVWHVKRFGWYTQNFHLELSGQVHFPQGASPVVNLQGAVNIPQLSQVAQLIAQQRLSPKLQLWLQTAFKSGGFQSSNLSLRGPLNIESFNRGQSILKLHGHITGLSFKFSKYWPKLYAPWVNLYLDGKRLQFSAEHMLMFGNPASNVHVAINDIMQPVMQLKFNSGTTITDGLNLLRRSPLLISTAFDAVKAKGLLSVVMRLMVPLYKRDETQARMDADFSFKHDQIRWGRLKPALVNVTGLVHVHNKKIDADNLKAFLLGEPLSVTMHTRQSKSGPLTRVRVLGRLSVDKLKQALSLSQLSFVRGTTPFILRMDLPARDSLLNKSMHFSSDLQGISLVGLPAPFLKEQQIKKQFRLALSMYPGKSVLLRAHYTNALAAALIFHRYKGKLALYSSNVHLGSDSVAYRQQAGLHIGGYIDRVNIPQWLSALHKYLPKASHDAVGQAVLKSLDLSIGRLEYGVFSFSRVKLLVKHLAAAWQVCVDGDDIKGKAAFPLKVNDPWRISLQYLYLSKLPKSHAGSTRLSPLHLPAMHLTIHQLRIGMQKYKNITVILAKSTRGIVVHQLDFSAQHGWVRAKGFWSIKQSEQQSYLEGSINSNNWGKFLAQWQSHPVLTRGQGVVRFRLWWPGSLYHVVWSDSVGQLKLNIQKGVFDQLSSSASRAVGVGQLLNLFSLGAMMHHFRSSFKDMPQHGLWFSSLDGHWSIRNGVAVTKDMRLQSEVAAVFAQGAVDLSQHRTDLWLQIVPQLTSGVPVVASILGGPLVGVVAWIANKVIGTSVDQLSTRIIHVTGTWKHTQVQAKRLVEGKWV
jgi:uncharacterized protein YhdP